MALHNVIYPRAVTEFVYRYHSPTVALVFLSFILNTNSRTTEVADVLATLDKLGMRGMDISDDEMAKSHARYMIGGRQEVENERLFRFGLRWDSHSSCSAIADDNPEFPERPTALHKFLHTIRWNWNISLFHYRNHGAGKVFYSSTCRLF